MGDGCPSLGMFVFGLLLLFISDGGTSGSGSRATITSGSSLSSPSSSSSSSVMSSHHHSSSSATSSKSKPSTTLDEEEDDYDGEYKDEDDDDLLDDEDYALHHPDSSSKVSKSREGREWISTTCPTPLRGHCHCGHQRDPADRTTHRPVVNCTHAGFTSTDFFYHVPPETVVLIVVGNELHYLPPNLFGVGPGREMTSLKELDLRQNGIVSLHGKTFHHTPHLETLILSFNNLSPRLLLDHPRLFSNLPALKYLHLSGAFAMSSSSADHDQYLLVNGLSDTFANSKLTNLMKLHLEQNHISRIPNPRLFCDLPSLFDLHLGQNELTELVLELEDCSPTLRFVDLSYNKIKGVGGSSGIFSILNHQNQMGVNVRVELYHNPFICDCSLDTFLLWMRNMTLKNPDLFRHRTEMRCGSGYPESNGKRMLQDVDHTECPPPITSTNTVIDRLSWSVVSLLSLSALSILLVWWLRSRGQGGGTGFLRLITPNSTGHPLLSTTTSGVKYVSVDKEEVAEVAHV